ncbi:H-type lectin domain-containing protein [Citreimonas salinaria]|uniref:H-type lectin domain-containing protein n=1 Tax=Citreimonas salinaria TaxID=321339 RepID=A0A1H3HP55_9RHOB|nr:H-type lectin domain-containing protein [Citreimonas salinaria]SDY17273.1 H-type lectin domain-containing protein [Citreimonas salinaria]
MQRFPRGQLAIDQGETEVFSEYEEGGPMWTGSGSRERRRTVTFATPFLAPPVVQATVSLWDTDQSTNLRADITAEHVTPEGCELVFRTWGDTRIARIRMRWIAIGAVASEDDWPV